MREKELCAIFYRMERVSAESEISFFFPFLFQLLLLKRVMLIKLVTSWRWCCA